MARGIIEILHVDATKVARYEPANLDHFAKILNDILNEFADAGDPLADPEARADTKARLAIALFQCAEAGERDYERLKRAAVAAVAASRRAASEGTA